MARYRREIKEKDLEQLAAVRELGLKFLISYDRDFEGVAEYRTPRAFLEELGLETASEAEF